MVAPEVEHTRQLAEAYGLAPAAGLQDIMQAILSRASIAGGSDESAAVLEVVSLAVREPAWSALVGQQPIPTNTVTGMIAAVDQHKPATAPAMVIEVVIHDIRQALAGGQTA